MCPVGFGPNGSPNRIVRLIVPIAMEVPARAVIESVSPLGTEPASILPLDLKNGLDITTSAGGDSYLSASGWATAKAEFSTLPYLGTRWAVVNAVTGATVETNIPGLVAPMPVLEDCLVALSLSIV